MQPVKSTLRMSSVDKDLVFSYGDASGVFTKIQALKKQGVTPS